MRLLDLMEGARNVVRSSAHVRSEDQVLVVANPSLTGTGQALTIAAQEAGAEVVYATMCRRPSNDREPPPAVAEAMRASTVVFAATETSIYHTRARLRACEAGSRVVALTGATEATLTRAAVKLNFPRWRPVVDRVARCYAGAETIRITSPGGTDLTARISGRRINAESGVCDRAGMCVGMPSVEINVAPLEGTAEGRIVIDASVAEFGVVDANVTLEVRQGRIVGISGGRTAMEMKRRFEMLEDPSAYVVAEIGLGMNPQGRVVGVLVEDESTLGTGHVGLGDNSTMGGVHRAPIHFDVIFWHPTIVLDGARVISKDGVVRHAVLDEDAPEDP